MKILLINGSPHPRGCTYTALCQVALTLEESGVGTELAGIGPGPVANCTVCRSCKTATPGRCIYKDDSLNSLLGRAGEFQGLVLGSPVHYASACGMAVSFFDRLFFAGGQLWSGKVGAAVVTCRRSGGSAALDQLNKYFTYHRMYQAGSQYWNIAHGNTPEELVQDIEGMQTLRTLGRHLAWAVRSATLAREQGLPEPAEEAPVKTNFIR